MNSFIKSYSVEFLSQERNECLKMGSEESKPKIETPHVTHEQIVGIINASNAKSSEHSEKTAESIELIAYVLIAVVIAGVVFLVYKLLTNYERMKTQAARVDNVCNVKSSIV